jgi:glycosyltransferase involved in cell wall biosynthesis
MHKLSIIIPAYNAEPYIEHLINRLKPQIRDDVEVLVVDDGSKFPYLPPYPWVRVIRQENKGLAGARNTGIENTTGKYLAFIDADDLVSEDFVDVILNRSNEE